MPDVDDPKLWFEQCFDGFTGCFRITPQSPVTRLTCTPPRPHVTTISLHYFAPTSLDRYGTVACQELTEQCTDEEEALALAALVAHALLVNYSVPLLNLNTASFFGPFWFHTTFVSN